MQLLRDTRTGQHHRHLKFWSQHFKYAEFPSLPNHAHRTSHEDRHDRSRLLVNQPIIPERHLASLDAICRIDSPLPHEEPRAGWGIASFDAVPVCMLGELPFVPVLLELLRHILHLLPDDFIRFSLRVSTQAKTDVLGVPEVSDSYDRAGGDILANDLANHDLVEGNVGPLGPHRAGGEEHLYLMRLVPYVQVGVEHLLAKFQCLEWWLVEENAVMSRGYVPGFELVVGFDGRLH